MTASVSMKELKNERITLTLPVINNARNIVFLITGKNKAGILRKVIDGEKEFPASLIRPKKGDIFFLLDEPAASELMEAKK